MTYEDAESVLNSAVSAMPGFDYDVRPAKVRKVSPFFGLFIALSALFGTGVFLSDQLHEWIADLNETVTTVLGAAIDHLHWPLIACLVLSLLCLLKNDQRGIRRALRNQSLPESSTSAGRVTPPREGGPKRLPRHDKEGNEVGEKTIIIKERDGDYPLNKTCFRNDAGVFASMCNPHGVTGVATSTAQRPPSVELQHSPGFDLGGSPIPDAAMDFGVYLNGEPGSGKSNTIQGLWGYHARRDPQTHPTSMIAFETKGDGTDQYLAQSRAANHPCLRIDANDPNAVAIGVFDAPGDAKAKAHHAVSVLRYAFSDGSVKERSAEALRTAYRAAYVWKDKHIPETVYTSSDETRRLVSPDYSVHRLAHVLLLGVGEETFHDIVESMQTYLSDHPDDDVQGALDALRPMLEARGTQLKAYTEAPRNKLDALVSMDYWFARKTVTFRQVIHEDRAVVILVVNPLIEQLI